MRKTSGADPLWPVGGRRGRYQQWRADASTCSVLWYGVGETWMQVLIYSQCSWKGLKRWCSNVIWYHHWPSQHLEDSFEELKSIRKYVDALIKNISERFRDVAQVLTAMQVFDTTAIPPKENGSDFTEYGQELIDVLAAHYFTSDEVNQ